MRVETVANTVAASSIVVAAKDQIGCDLGGEEVILDLKSGVYYGLNSVGSRIWSLLLEPISVGRVVDVITSEYEVETDECFQAVSEFLQQMIDNRLVEIGVA